MSRSTIPPSHARIAALMHQLVPVDGFGSAALPGITLGRSSQPLQRAPVMYEPSVCFVLQGRKTCHLGGASYVYDAHHYLVVSAPLSLECETEASEATPLFGLLLQVDAAMLAELLLLLDQSHGSSPAKPTGIVTTAIGPAMADAVQRLLQALCSPDDARVLGPGIVREIFYRVLTGEQGGALRSALAYRGEFGQISKALRRIHENCAAPIDVATLARQANMSPATFHTKFKMVTSTSPMQYLKATRLHQARLLMLQDGLTAGAAATRVGYESVSQFSREFKRLFSRTPTDEMEQMRGLYREPPHAKLPRYVTAP